MSDTDPAGWQPDPTGRHEHRYWDGTAWTDNISDAGVAGTDPFSAPSAPDATVADAPTAPVPPVASTPPTDATAAWSTTPGAPVPPAAASGGGSGSKTGLLIGGAILAVIAIIVAVLLLTGGDDEGDEVRTDLIGALTNPDQGNLSQDDAECVADDVIDNVDGDVLADVDYSADDPPQVLQGAIISAYEACDVDFGGGSSDDTTTTEGNDEETTTTSESSSDDGGSTDGELPDGFVDQLADIYESSLGLSRDQAECLAGRIGEVVQAGELSEDEAFSEIFDYLADCDISLSDVSGN